MQIGFKQPFWITENPPAVWGKEDGVKYMLMECPNKWTANFQAMRANMTWQKSEYGEVDKSLFQKFEKAVQQVLAEMVDAGEIVATGEFQDGSPVYRIAVANDV